MPIRRGTSVRQGKTVGYYQYGGQKRYAYTPGVESSRVRAYGKAARQMRAIRYSQSRAKR